jgi:hypothetical protein
VLTLQLDGLLFHHAAPLIEIRAVPRNPLLLLGNQHVLLLRRQSHAAHG